MIAEVHQLLIEEWTPDIYRKEVFGYEYIIKTSCTMVKNVKPYNTAPDKKLKKQNTKEQRVYLCSFCTN